MAKPIHSTRLTSQRADQRHAVGRECSQPSSEADGSDEHRMARSAGRRVRSGPIFLAFLKMQPARVLVLTVGGAPVSASQPVAVVLRPPSTKVSAGRVGHRETGVILTIHGSLCRLG